MTYDQAVAGVEPADVVHRPQQVFTVDDLNLLWLLAGRLVVTHQDLIAYHNPAYHATLEAWERYRRVTRLALASADRVVFFTEHSREDAEAEDLLDGTRSDVIGVAPAAQAAGTAQAPPGDRLPADRPFMLCLGADYAHKNRPFAIALLAALRAEHDWPGLLVLAGGHVDHGSSAAAERSLLEGDERLRAAVVDLGPVEEAQRRWLIEHARAVVVPSVIEGFGLVPLEAAEAGRPCLFAPVSSLPEVIAPALAALVPWNASLSATRVLPLLRDGPERSDHVTSLRASAARWSWQRLATELVAAYESALGSPHRAAAPRAWQELERERHLVAVERSRVELDAALVALTRRHEELLGHIGPRLALASDDGFLTAREQRGLLRVGSRPALARATLWPFALLGAIPRPRGRN